MDAATIVVLTFLIFAAAVLYSSVGHAGASGYMAAMALFGLASDVMKPTALVLNIVVAIVGTYKFYAAGHFSWRLFWPLAVGSVPLAFCGGGTALDARYYNPLVGVALLIAAARLIVVPRSRLAEGVAPPPIYVSIILGAALGYLSGLTGVGGGIYLSPILLLAGWAAPRETSAASVTFILVNSISGLAGHLSRLHDVPWDAITYWAPAALVGGLIGAELGSRRLESFWIRRLLGVVLVVAGCKMLFAKL